MRIYVLTSVFPALGETFVLNQITGLIDRGHEVVVLARDRGSGPVHAEVERYGLGESYRSYPKRAVNTGTPGKGLGHWLRVAAANPGFTFRSLNPARFGRRATSARILFEGLAWAEAVREVGPPDVVIAHHGGNGLNAVRVRRAGAFSAPVLTVFHGSDANRARPGKFDELFREGDLMLPVSGFLRDKLLEIGCSPDKAVVHHMGIEPDAFAAPARARTDRIKLVSVGRLIPVKGFHHSIRAVAGLPDDLRERVDYRIIGAGPEQGALSEEIERLGLAGSVSLLGSQTRDRVAQILGESEVMVFPSAPVTTGEKEGIPMSLAEAMASGLAIIATDLGGIPELIRDGRDGLIVPAGQSSAITDAMARLVGDPDLCRRLGESAVGRVRERHDIDALNDALVAMLERIISADLDGARV